jgi:hypothetical protein
VLFAVLAIGTVPVATTAKHGMMFFALIAFKDYNAEVFASAVANGGNRLSLSYRHF